MQDHERIAPVVLTADLVVAEGNPLKNNDPGPVGRDRNGKRIRTNFRDRLFSCEDPIVGLHEETIEAYAHAYGMNAQIRSSATFEVYLRMCMMGATSGGQPQTQDKPAFLMRGSGTRWKGPNVSLSWTRLSVKEAATSLRALCERAGRQLGWAGLGG
jgi:hypothetical protein